MDTSKIIIGKVNTFGKYSITSPIFKEDYGLYLQIEGVELPQTYEVDFSNSENSGTSVTMIGNADGVLIPSQFISTGKDIFAFLYHVGADYGRTVYKFRIPNKVRPDRTNEEPTPEEQSVIDQAINALNEAVTQTAQDVISADQSARSAQGYAEQAETAKTNAQTYANNAQTSATQASASASQASASATASANSASASAQIKADVEELVDDAQGYANSASQSASASAQSASDAQGYAQSASESASSASGYASSAQGSANTASQKATEASGYAQTASTKASEASASATTASNKASEASGYATASQTAQGLAESARDTAASAKTDAESARDDAESARDEAQQAVASISDALMDKADIITDTASGSIASFSDGADNLPLKSLVVDINPVQDLHGQDAPYPAGGGANKFDGIMVADGSYLLSANYIPVTGGQTWYIYAPNFPASDYCYGKFYDSNFSEIDAGTPHRIGRNTTYTIPSGVAYIKLRYWGTFDATNMAFNYPATVTTYSPYENICPISGWTQVDVEQSGVNVWDEEWELGTFTANHEWGTGSYLGAKNPVRVVPNVTYYNFCPSGVLFVFYNSNGEYIEEKGVASNSTFTAPSGATTMRFRTFQAYGTTYNHDISINYPSTDHDYHPYTGRSITIDLGQTVYGAKLYPLEGKAVIDMAMVDMGTLVWRYSGDSLNHRFSAPMPSNYLIPTSVGDRANVMCSNYASNPNVVAITSELGISGYQGVTTIYVRDLNYSDSAIFKSAMDGVQLVYELAEPIEIQLSPNQVNSLLGVNNIWADSGDTDVEYRADTKLFIERLTAPDSADMIADANITSGQYFMVGNTLYKATANIANGGQIIVGTNCTRVSLAQALNEINA